MKKTVLALAALAVAAGAAHAADSKLLNTLLACNADYFKAIAADKNIPETLKIRDGDRAYLKVEKQPLDIVNFPKSFKDSGLTVTGYVFNDEIIRYPGVPDMHTHFWGLIVKEDWKTAIDAFRVDWEQVDTRHMSAHANRMSRANDEKVWKAYKRPDKYEYPELGVSERAFHVQPWNGQTMIFCSMQTAGAPEGAILQEVRPDLLFGEQQVPIREEEIVKDQPKPAAADGKKLPEGHPAIPADGKLPEGHPDISGAKK
ncbi:hypothetical protein [Sutterella sp.]|uniref:hypothetical protein n=1 Tax=Sutterella sp. TaxID=1981025 RepID=UPI0026E0C9F6|nr:hypothetical protein [Sutterella sp.]MDO5531573.1 hypothetical protein [Sutterella sp.]